MYCLLLFSMSRLDDMYKRVVANNNNRSNIIVEGLTGKDGLLLYCSAHQHHCFKLPKLGNSLF